MNNNLKNASSGPKTQGGSNQQASPSNKPKPRRFFPKFTFGTAIRLILLTVFVFLIWGTLRDRLSPASWKIPIDYSGDTINGFACFKAASEGDFNPGMSKLVGRLGAPYQANWNDFPAFEQPILYGMGLVARSSDVFVASNVGVFLACLTAVLSFYGCCRYLRFRMEWAMTGAILFGFTYFQTYRGLGHLTVAFTYIIPPLLLTCWLLTASKRMKMWSPSFWFCIVIGFLIGWGNPYNLNMFLQLLCFSMLVHFLLRRRKTANLFAGVFTFVAAAAGFVMASLPTIIYNTIHGSNASALHRFYFQSELYGLKLIDLMMPPPTHHSDFFAALGTRFSMQAWVKGEMFFPYLGVVALAALVWMAIEFSLRMLNLRKSPALVSSHVPVTGWILLYSTIGGLNGVLAFCGIAFFRSSNRYSIFLSAICLFFLASRLSLISRRWSRSTSYAAAFVILAIGLYDELPKSATRERTLMMTENIEIDRAFANAMETSLPPKSMVFQMPVIDYPESFSHKMGGGDLFRPYLFTSTLRFSFGNCTGRPRDAWMLQETKLPAEQMVKDLEKYGFAAIYINRNGYEDAGEAVLKNLARCGKTKTIEDPKHEQVCVFLTPSEKPELPPDNNANIVYKKGWVLEEPSQNGVMHWAEENASLVVINEEKAYQHYYVSGVVYSLSPRQLELERDGVSLWKGTLNANQGALVRFELDGKPGRNRINFTTDAGPVQPREGIVPLSYALINWQFSKIPVTEKQAGEN